MLIITQKVNKEDPVLGFFHDWIIEFAKYESSLTVLCLELGTYNLPAHVKVISLGKEKAYSKIRIMLNFFWVVFTQKFDSVFVHMNQEYILLAGWYWRLCRTKIFFWRNHPKGNFLTKIAIFFSNIIYCTSEQSFTHKFKKTKRMPVGVRIKSDFQKSDIKNKMICFGRISPVKYIETIADAYLISKKKYPDLSLEIFGDPTNKDQDKKYYNNLVSQYGLEEKIFFRKGVSHENIETVYSDCDICVNATLPGSFDKTIIEAMSFGVPVFVCQDIWQGTRFQYLKEHFFYPFADSEILSQKIISFYQLPEFEKNKLQKDVFMFAKEYHSLESLVKKVIEDI